MTDANRRVNVSSELARADGDFVLTAEALREDLAACEGFLSRARGIIAKALE